MARAQARRPAGDGSGGPRAGRQGPRAGAAAPQALSYRAIRSGMKARAVLAMVEDGRLRRGDIDLVIARRTFERRCAEDQDLRIDEADAIARLLRVRDHARRAMGSGEAAEIWLTRPNPALDGEVPLEMARTDIGAREVEAVLGRFEHGVHG